MAIKPDPAAQARLAQMQPSALWVELQRRMADECPCEFDPDPNDPDESILEDAWHYRRACLSCCHVWWSLHCAHEEPRPCPQCGVLQTREQAIQRARAMINHWDGIMIIPKP